MLRVGNTFDSIHDARSAIKAYVLDQAESFKTVASDKTQYIIACKDANCGFYIQAYKSFKDLVLITASDPYICTLTTHYKMKQTSLV
jgi:hypothetical protein